jgi:hypothetical protein
MEHDDRVRVKLTAVDEGGGEVHHHHHYAQPQQHQQAYGGWGHGGHHRTNAITRYGALGISSHPCGDCDPNDPCDPCAEDAASPGGLLSRLDHNFYVVFAVVLGLLFLFAGGR